MFKIFLHDKWRIWGRQSKNRPSFFVMVCSMVWLSLYLGRKQPLLQGNGFYGRPLNSPHLFIGNGPWKGEGHLEGGRNPSPGSFTAQKHDMQTIYLHVIFFFWKVCSKMIKEYRKWYSCIHNIYFRIWTKYLIMDFTTSLW